MDKHLLGQILASVVVAAVNLGGVSISKDGVTPDPKEIENIVSGFLAIWLPQATQANSQAKAAGVGL